MKEFLLIFRSNIKSMPELSPEQMQANTKRWMDWIGGIAAQNKLSNRGNRLSNTGRVLKSDNTITDGPYAEIKESIGGFIVIKVGSYDEAVETARGCPILSYGGNVEVREISAL